MRDVTRRDLLKNGLTAVGAMALTPLATHIAGVEPDRIVPPNDTSDTASTAAPIAADATGRERLLLDFQWRFHLGHATDPAKDFGFGSNDAFAKVGNLLQTPSRPRFDDSTWQQVNVPHDWAVELPFENARPLNGHGYKPLGRQYPETSVGWYRRAFTLPESDAGRRISIEFDGIYRDAVVALNGNFLGRNLSGYAPFRFDVTDLVNLGTPNVLVVRVDATETEGWFYEGAGIYRHTWLVKTNAIHVPQWGTFVTADVKGTSAALAIATEVDNETDRAASVRVVSTVRDASGRTVATSRSIPSNIAPWARATVKQQVLVSKPLLWSPDSPTLHTLTTTLEVAGVETDRYEIPFGIRTLAWDADTGFSLNGKRVELKGTCNHQDHAGVGVALPDRLQSYRIEKLKEMGSNAYRTSHNPPTPELLDACDRLGMLVLDESRMFSAEPEGLSQLERMIRRDRNRPSIFAWSIANEEWAEQGTARGAKIAATLRRFVRSLDPSRPVTAAMDSAWGTGISLSVDVQGCNYQRNDIDAFHAKFPKQPIFGTETLSAYQTRGIYATDKERGYVSAYDVNKPSYGATAEEWWGYFAARPYLGGGFVWTGFDYRGEPSPYQWPCISSHFGIIDTCGFPKDTFYYYQAWWGDTPVLHLFPHWNWAGKEGQAVEVWAHSNLDRVELFLNGKSLGAQPVPRNGHVMWKVPYAPGTIEARGFTGTAQTLVSRRETTGPAVRVELVPDRQSIAGDGEDVSVVAARVLDAQGRVVPSADDAITFTVSGPGHVIGVGNGDPSSHEADKASARHAFNGLCMAIVQSTKEAGDIRVEAAAPGLQTATITLTSVAAVARAAAL